MNKITKIIIAIIAIILIIWAITAIVGKTKNQEANKATGTIKIGVIIPLSGDAAAYGEQTQRIMNYYLPEINAKYKDQNVSFELIYEDGKCNGTDAVSAFQKLTDIDNVKFIIGGFCSSESLAIAPLTSNKQILALSMGSSNPDIKGASDYLYTFSYNDNVMGTTLAEKMNKYNKVAIITEQNDYNIGLQKVWLEAIKQYPNVTVVANETFAKGGTDFRNILEKVKKTNPEAIFINPNAGVTAQNLVKQLAEIKDWNNYQLFGAFTVGGEDVLRTAPEKTENMIVVDSPQITNTEFLALSKNIENSQGTLGDIGLFYTATTIDIMNILTDLIVKNGNDATAVKDALTSQDFNGYIGDNFNFKNSNFPGIGASIYVVKNGQLEAQQ